MDLRNRKTVRLGYIYAIMALCGIIMIIIIASFLYNSYHDDDYDYSTYNYEDGDDDYDYSSSNSTSGCEYEFNGSRCGAPVGSNGVFCTKHKQELDDTYNSLLETLEDLE